LAETEEIPARDSNRPFSVSPVVKIRQKSLRSIF